MMELDFIVETLNSMKVVEKDEFNILRKKLVDFCMNGHVLTCYRELDRIKQELLELLEESDSCRCKIIKKLIHLIELELYIADLKIKHPELTEDTAWEKYPPCKRLKWTASVSDLLEIIYLIRPDINNGEIDIKEIAELFEYMLQVNLDNRYKLIRQIAARKKNKTKYIDDSKQKLVDFFEELNQKEPMS